jgi:D-alanyl-lipoteichoic acid acyltransferase DltB (MBOAT superfamily)
MELQVIVLLFCIPLVALSWALPENWQRYPGILITALFLGLYAPESLLILTLTTLFSYYVLKYSTHIAAALIVVCVVIFSIFMFFKLGLGKTLWIERLLPLGISYYSFRQIHYAMEAYKRKLPAHDLKDYFTYLFFLPTLLIGPIHRFPEFMKDGRRRRWDNDLFSEGLERILYGFVKTIVLGNYLISERGGALMDMLEEKGYLWLSTYVDVVRYIANSYMQFAGFSDIAIGLALLMGYRVMENFDSPFRATDISDFWQRWHISLSTWCREYVYFPFYSVTRNYYIGIFFSMLILALWHDITWQYLAWAAVHVVGINTWHIYHRSALRVRLHRFMFAPVFWGRFITFHFVVLSFVLISGKNGEEIWRTFKILFGFHV